MCIKVVKTMKKNPSVEYVSIEEFSNRYNLKPQTILKNYKKIRGIKMSRGELIILSSARYPYNMRNTHLKKREEKMYVLLKATREFYYIDSKMLKISEYSFNTMIKEMLNLGILIENNSGNNDGANAYDTTTLTENFLNLSKRKAIKEMLSIMANTSGTFVGAALSQMNS